MTTEKISIHAPRVRCDAGARRGFIAVCGISIHAPRVRCDISKGGWDVMKLIISIHAPRVRCDKKQNRLLSITTIFQSTHLV